MKFKKKRDGSDTRLVLLTKELADMHKETAAFPNFEEFLDGDGSESWMLLNFDCETKKKKKHSYFF